MSKRSTAALLKKARRRRVSFTVVLDLGDGAQDAYDAAVDELSALDAADEGHDELRAKIVELHGQVEAAEFSGEFEALPPLKWAALLDDHQPRENNQGDQFYGANRATVFAPAIRACMTDPVLDEDEWQAFLDAISAGDLDRLARQVFELNARTATVPKLPSDFLRTTPPA